LLASIEWLAFQATKQDNVLFHGEILEQNVVLRTNPQ
jgi:hypothetical protein